jgi:uncharacterized protein (DUF1810 family)
MRDPYDLRRFTTAQNAEGTYARAVAELRAGYKASHWMWFVFPQIAGLGRSATSKRFALSSLAEAEAYVGHSVLGPRLFECTRIVAETEDRSAGEIFGLVDAQKLHSSMTLFERAMPGEQLFSQVLGHYFHGVTDAATEALLSALANPERL